MRDGPGIAPEIFAASVPRAKVAMGQLVNRLCTSHNNVKAASATQKSTNDVFVTDLGLRRWSDGADQEPLRLHQGALHPVELRALPRAEDAQACCRGVNFNRPCCP